MSEIERCIAEQASAREAAVAGDAGARLGASDWLAEETILRSFSITEGDAVERLREMESCSFDACLCDPPYGLSFMGKAWDHGVPAVETWMEVLRVLKPGAMLLAFGGTRTHHRLMCAIEDAGFEIRDCLMWLYGSGFPKSLDIGKALDKRVGAVREQAGTRPAEGGRNYESWRAKEGRTDLPPNHKVRDIPVLLPSTEAAKQWDGYGTALKPAWEPIILAMKPCAGTFAENALQHGVAGLNIEAGRIESDGRPLREARRNNESDECRSAYGKGLAGSRAIGSTDAGRWPANLILDEAAAALLDEHSGDLHATGNKKAKATDAQGNDIYGAGLGEKSEGHVFPNFGDSGGASRFFYVAKAASSERNGAGKNNHPTVKPVDLAAYLAKLILPPTRETPRRLLVPYSGSGSEIIGALRAGWDEAVGIEISAEYAEMARRRITNDAPLLNTEQDAMKLNHLST